MTLTAYLILSAALFGFGILGMLVRRNMIVMLMCVELMLNAANLALAGFSRFIPGVDGQVLAFLVIAIAASEAAVGLALVVNVARARQTVDVDTLNLLKG